MIKYSTYHLDVAAPRSIAAVTEESPVNAMLHPEGGAFIYLYAGQNSMATELPAPVGLQLVLTRDEVAELQNVLEQVEAGLARLS